MYRLILIACVVSVDIFFLILVTPFLFSWYNSLWGASHRLNSKNEGFKTYLRVCHLDWQTGVTVSPSRPYKVYLIPLSKSPSWHHTGWSPVSSGLQHIQHLISDIFVHRSSLDQYLTRLLELIPVLAHTGHTPTAHPNTKGHVTLHVCKDFPHLHPFL